MAEVTTLVVKADLGCKRCYKKIKKLLNKIPEIEDWAFFEKDNKVTIKVAPSYSETVRMQLKSKGGKTIESVDVRAPEKPTPKPKAPAYTKPIHQLPGRQPCNRIGGFCKPCDEGHCGGLCHRGCGIPPQPPCNDCSASGCRCNRSCGCRCDRSCVCICQVYIEENPTCTILWIIIVIVVVWFLTQFF